MTTLDNSTVKRIFKSIRYPTEQKPGEELRKYYQRVQDAHDCFMYKEIFKNVYYKVEW